MMAQDGVALRAALREDTPAGIIPAGFEEHFADGRPAGAHRRDLAVEAPVALEFDGINYAVMMATPIDLADFARGFAIGEGLLAPGAAALPVEVVEVENGWIVRARLPGGGAPDMLDRVRRRIGDSSCGLCGIETLEQVARPLPPVKEPCRPAPAAIFRALGALPDRQALGGRTGAMHAAAICRPDGEIVLLREDAGRHNAFDKAVGAMTSEGLRGPLFALLSARCSYELVEKAVRARLGALVTVSAPTSMAWQRAEAAGLPLYVLAREDSLLRAV